MKATGAAPISSFRVYTTGAGCLQAPVSYPANLHGHTNAQRCYFNTEIRHPAWRCSAAHERTQHLSHDGHKSDLGVNAFFFVRYHDTLSADARHYRVFKLMVHVWWRCTLTPDTGWTLPGRYQRQTWWKTRRRSRRWLHGLWSKGWPIWSRPPHLAA